MYTEQRTSSRTQSRDVSNLLVISCNLRVCVPPSVPLVSRLLTATRSQAESALFNVSDFIAENDRIVRDIDSLISRLSTVHSSIGLVSPPSINNTLTYSLSPLTPFRSTPQSDCPLNQLSVELFPISLFNLRLAASWGVESNLMTSTSTCGPRPSIRHQAYCSMLVQSGSQISRIGLSQKHERYTIIVVYWEHCVLRTVGHRMWCG